MGRGMAEQAIEERDTETLAEQVALVTGGGRGLGAAVAESLLDAGATVIVNALTTRFLGPLVERLRERHGSRIYGVAGDVATATGAGAVVARAIEIGGSLTILVNSVGDAVQRDLAPSHDEAADVDAIETILDLNLKSAIYCTRAVASTMIARRRGRVINLASVIGGLSGESRLSVYAAGKAALVGFTRSLAREWAQYGITVNAIAPGIFPDVEAMPPEQLAAVETAFLDRIPLGRLGRASEIGHLAAFLASGRASYITGQIIACDGGLSA
jgi:NAD(P)-dependent dehydrogenase (short-subunit alcohol dehydrogenase family)